LLPLGELGEKVVGGKTIENRGEYSEVAQQVSFHQEGLDDLRAVGPRMRPKHISMRIQNAPAVQDTHDFDFANVYTIDRVWQCGSCPHLFFILDDEILAYGRELIAQGSGETVSDRFVVPEGANKVVIAELEHETTHLEVVMSEGETVCRNVWLQRGDWISFSARSGQVFEVAGAYFEMGLSGPRSEIALMRNRLVCRFMRNWQTDESARNSCADAAGARAIDHNGLR
jgi:hypothetical protein